MLMMKESDAPAQMKGVLHALYFWMPSASKIVELLGRALLIEEQIPNQELRSAIGEQNFQDIAEDVPKYNPLILTTLRRQQENLPASLECSPFASACDAIRSGIDACSETVSSKGRKLQYCGGCRRVPYCSPECQKSEWKCSPDPHKAVCRKLKTFCQVLKLPATPEHVKDSVVDKWCETTAISLDNIVVIKLHFEGLAFPSKSV
ncbi:hypothetical protein IW261DRAFT_809890 [Armillaria novae-zelandiae]|uniref:MYND-type domain-containing protein n=1 Tax=Armillaria novae-zelandiae TaxID=153914 RepID=A0AA39NV91_9AGAR|nr:hypothetical protein IW261DRAFT_809890 [Armillaria novae-zelandiae]